jgi:spermidine synthase
LKLGQRRLDWFWTALRGDASGDEVGESEPMSKHVNRDLYPVGLYRGLAYWNALFSPRLMQVIEAAGQFRLWMWGLVIVGAVAAALALARHNTRGRRAIVFIAIATTGFSGMAADLIIIFAFQTLYGHVYQWVVLLITAFMAGLSLGAWVMMRRSMRPGRALLSLLKLELAMVLYWVFSPLALTVLYSNVAHPAIYSAILGALLLLNVVAGFLVGSEFPVASRLWLAERQTVGSTAGALYAGDLIGAFGGAILVSVLLVPVLGIVETCILVAMLKLGSLALVATLTRHT